MSNPLSLLPIALAAGGGSLDGQPAASAVAAGFTLLQRSAPLVRALAGRRSAILLPPSAAAVTALAASDGHGAVLLSESATTASLRSALDLGDVGAVFTTRALAARLPQGERAVVVLDEAPRAATVFVRGVESTVDLGSHFGLELEGEEDEGRDEECLLTLLTPANTRATSAVFSHRNLLALARGAVDAASLLKRDRTLAAMPLVELGATAFSMLGPLLAGAHVTTMAHFDANEAIRRIEDDGITHLVGDEAMYAAMAARLDARGRSLAARALRVCVGLGFDFDTGVHDDWRRLTGVELRVAVGTADAPLSLFNAPHFPNRPGTFGVPFPGMQLSVRDTRSGATLSPGTAGTLWVRGSAVARRALEPDAGAPSRGDEWVPTHLCVRERPDGAFEPVR